MSIGESMERRAEEFVQRYRAVREQIVGHDEIVHGVLTCLSEAAVAGADPRQMALFAETRCCGDAPAPLRPGHRWPAQQYGDG